MMREDSIIQVNLSYNESSSDMIILFFQFILRLCVSERSEINPISRLCE